MRLLQSEKRYVIETFQETSLQKHPPQREIVTGVLLSRKNATIGLFLEHLS